MDYMSPGDDVNDKSKHIFIGGGGGGGSGGGGGGGGGRGKYL